MLINHYLAVIDYKAHEHYGFFSQFSTAKHRHLFSSAGVITSAMLCLDLWFPLPAWPRTVLRFTH